jgi:hypothetical protein
MNLSLVVAGLDPAIHRAGQHASRFIMDARVKPAHDEVCSSQKHELNTPARTHYMSLLNRNQSFCSSQQSIEKSSFFALRQILGFQAKPLNRNRSAKP